MEEKLEEITAPTWQRILTGIFAPIAALGVIVEVIAWIESSTVPLLPLFRNLMALVGIYLFAHIAIKGRLPHWMSRRKKKQE